LGFAGDLQAISQQPNREVIEWFKLVALMDVRRFKQVSANAWRGSRPYPSGYLQGYNSFFSHSRASAEVPKPKEWAVT